MRRDEEEVVREVIDHLGYVPNVGGSVLIDADEDSSLSKSIAFDKHLPLKMLPVELPENPYPIAIIMLKNRTLSPLAKVFVECAHEMAMLLAKAR
jgi:hypothetical protein